jgi:hypothetical protein
MQITGLLMLYTGGAYHYALGAPTAAAVAEWPTDGVQVGLLFFDAEWAPGQPNRQVMMGNNSYFFVPSTGVVGHNDESVSEIRERYGADTIVWRGQWTTPAEIDHLSKVALACDTVEKITNGWLDAALQ